MTPPKDTPKDGRRHEAALDRLRAKGNHLAPVMVDGRVRPKGSGKHPASGGVTPGRSAAEGPGKVITPTRTPDRSTGHAAGETFELVIPSPGEWLNENYRLDRWEKARRVKAWRGMAALLASRANFPQGLERLRVDAYVIKPVANNYDPSNYAPTSKACLDGLIDAGLAADDNRKIVTGPFMHDGGKGEPALRVVVTVLETKESAA